MNYCKNTKYSERQVWANSVDPDQTAPSSASTLFAILSPSFGRITVHGKTTLLNFRKITAIFSGVQIFRSFTVCPQFFWNTSEMNNHSFNDLGTSEIIIHVSEKEFSCFYY